MRLAGGSTGCLGFLHHFFGRWLLKMIAVPYELAMKAAQLEPKLQAIGPSEQFMIYIKTSVVFGLIVSVPWIFYQLWAFISAGLYRHEKKFIHIAAPVSAALCITVAVFFLLVGGNAASAHESRPLYVEIVEKAPNTYAVSWKIPPSALSVTSPVVVMPEVCTASAPPAGTRLV